MNDARKRDVMLGNTLLVAKLFPFIYSVLLMILSVWDVTASPKWNLAIELVFFASLPFAILCLLLAYTLKFCKWYCLQCGLMLAPISIPLYGIFSPDTDIVWLRWGITITLFLCTFKCSYMFFGSNLKRTYRKLKNKLINQTKQTL